MKKNKLKKIYRKRKQATERLKNAMKKLRQWKTCCKLVPPFPSTSGGKESKHSNKLESET